MYAQFFGFDKLPFRLRPDPDFLYSGQQYLRARAKLLAALSAGSRVILLTGSAGVGKTTLLDDILNELAGRYAFCRINQPHISGTELLQALLLQLGAPSVEEAGQMRPFAELAASLGSIAARKAAPLLIIDDAQLLAEATLRTFRDILARVPQLTILLGVQAPRCGVEDLAARLCLAEAPVVCHLDQLAAEAAIAYVERRLVVAGGGREIFSPQAHATILQHTGGTPRLINVLCDAALHAACMRASGLVGAADILLATQDARWPEAVARAHGGQGNALHAGLSGQPGHPEDTHAAPAQLYVSQGTEYIAAWPLKPGRISIGRAPDNELRLEAPFISRHHCHVVTVGKVSTIEDLGSVNGMCVNGRAVKRHVLRHEDQVALGEHVLTYLQS